MGFYDYPDVDGTTPTKQYDQLSIRCINQHISIGNEYSSLGFNDIGKTYGDKTEDSFNFYAIDVENRNDSPTGHTIGMVRFEADTVYDLSKRDADIVRYES